MQVQHHTCEVWNGLINQSYHLSSSPWSPVNIEAVSLPLPAEICATALPNIAVAAEGCLSHARLLNSADKVQHMQHVLLCLLLSGPYDIAECSPTQTPALQQCIPTRSWQVLCSPSLHCSHSLDSLCWVLPESAIVTV